MKSTTDTIIRPAKPVAPWIGGKMRLAKQICAIIDATRHKHYAEPFVGMGGIFFRRSKPVRFETINDLSQDVTNLFRICQRHYDELAQKLCFGIGSRDDFERMVSTNPETMTDIERAVRFLIIQRQTYAGKLIGPTFPARKDSPSKFNIQTLKPLLHRLHERLTGVTIERLDYGPFIKRYDTARTLFYLDPPYWGYEGYYGKALFNREDFDQIADQLAQINGKFIMSINDVPQIREIFGAFRLTSVSTIYNAGANNDERKELLISNFQLPKIDV